MDPGKPTKTLADYMVITISPVLIMLLVHSVCFFLVEVFYCGEGAGGVRWVLFWFVLAVVLIARIGMEQGEGHATLYGLGLAGVTWIYLDFVQVNPIFGALLLAAVWFMAHKITVNCTLIDDDADASGQGLMQSLRRLPSLFKKTQPHASGDVPSSPAPSPGRVTVRVPGFGPKQQPESQAARRPAAPVPTKKKTSPAIPGIWLIYFSLAALPVFGLGQPLLPAGDFAARREGFIYLFCFLAAALGLLITTSFLGLRRYLRQRCLPMPGNIAFGWIQFGVVAAMMVLVLALLLPRPGAGEAWGALRYHVDHQLRRASDYAARFNPHGAGPGRAGNQESPNGQQGNKSGSGSDSNPNPDHNGNTQGQNGRQSGGGSGAAEGGNQPHDNGPGQAGNQGANGQQPQKSAQPNPPPNQNQDDHGQSGVSAKPTANSSPAPSSLFSWLRVLFWIAVALGLAWLSYLYRAMILAMLQGIWAAIRSFLALLLGLFKPASAARPQPVKKSALVPFKSFKNPFLTGADRVWSPDKLIAYSYDGLQSWALEQAAEHGSPQTPREFCRQLGEEIPEAADALEHLAFLYGHVAYGASVPGNYHPEHLRLIWDYMANPRARRSNAPVPENELVEKV